MTINSLLTNSLNPDQIARYEVACNYYYGQLSFTWFKEANKPLKEEISKANYNKSYNIETYLKRLITKYYTKSSLDNFINELLLILKEYESIN